MSVIEQLYEAAHRAGFLKRCVWQPKDGSAPHIHMVGIAAPDEMLLDGLTLSTETAMTYPASAFTGLQARDRVDIDGAAYQVRDIRAIGDGAELRAKLTRL